MIFWDTVAGKNLAETLTRTMPKLVAKQYTLEAHKRNFKRVVDSELSKGHTYVNHFADGDIVIIIFRE